MHGHVQGFLTSYSRKGTRTHSAHSIQKGLYARKNTSVQRLPASSASHRLCTFLGAAPNPNDSPQVSHACGLLSS